MVHVCVCMCERQKSEGEKGRERDPNGTEDPGKSSNNGEGA